MTHIANLGYPRFGAKRELKRALEGFWSGKLTEEHLQEEARSLRQTHWQRQQQHGIDIIPSNDFSLYDHVLDTAVLVGAVPERYGWTDDQVDVRTSFAMARGGQNPQGEDVHAMEMTKWFDTNYHYIVPEFAPGQQFRLASRKPLDEFREAQALGITTRPVLLGPVSFLLLGKVLDGSFQPLDLLDSLLPVYAAVLQQLADAGAEWVQLDEPCLVQDLDAATHDGYTRAYTSLRAAAPSLKLMLTTYFGDLREHLSLVLGLPIDGLHLDLIRAPQQLDAALAAVPDSLVLSLGVIDGRNIWRADLDMALTTLRRASNVLGADRVIIAPSCSLLHVPVDLTQERKLDADLRSWLAFAEQKLDELTVLKRALTEGEDAVAEALAAQRDALASRRSSPKVTNPAVQERLNGLTPEMARRHSDYLERHTQQVAHLKLPLLPTTTIGSFPQTAAIRQQRADAKAGRSTNEQYEAFLRDEIARTVHMQEQLGLDVLVHGESERTDMVEYFAEQLTGIAFTDHGWVQSYGSRGVRPPVLYGDVARPAPMTVRWSTYAQSLTSKPIKGMLTGPITIVEWSFVRDDVPRSVPCRQIALALRDEVRDLEAAGIEIIQIDEPALREGLPLRRDAWDTYLDWAVESFRLASSGVRDTTQIHTHMCYAEFNDIIGSIAAMDADVISIESSRSKMELLDIFTKQQYPNGIGPGAYDIHSPLVPNRNEMTQLIRRALQVLTSEQLWINPDCGLKTRQWEEVVPALTCMVDAARAVRKELDTTHI